MNFTSIQQIKSKWKSWEISPSLYKEGLHNKLTTDNNEKTRTCNVCGKDLPLTRFSLKKPTNKNWKPYHLSTCKKCEYLKSVDKKWDISEEVEILIVRRYKKILPQRILDLSVKNINISLLGEDEIFVNMTDYKDSWISNYGRIIVHKSNGSYNLVKLTQDKYGSLIYNLPKCVFDSVKNEWIIKQTSCYIAREVVSEFVVNEDIENNNYFWHTSFDKSDNYYKHLYPLNKEQYFAVKMNYQKYGDDSEETILRIMNDIKFKPDNWGRKYLEKLMCNIGYHGNYYEDISKRKSYSRWLDMMQRSYNEKFHIRNPQYKGCEVCEEWHNYSNFKHWYDKNIYYIDDERMDIDKDVLFKGNNVYSPETCCIIPHSINTLILSSKKTRGDQPIGVFFDKDKGKYRSCMSYCNKSIKLGTFNTPELAFERYKEYKEYFIKRLAEQYKGKIPYKVYLAMVNWKMEITD